MMVRKENTKHRQVNKVQPGLVSNSKHMELEGKVRTST